MRVLAAYMLATLGGNANPSISDLEKILGSVGIELDDEAKQRGEKLIKELEGKNLSELIKEGEAKLSNAPIARGGVSAGVSGGTSANDGADKPKEEAAQESEESDGVSPFFHLF